MKKFRNVPNECITHDNKKVWLSRAVGVTGIVVCEVKGERYLLISKRGKGTPNYQGCYNIPCGYLDWNESLKEGVIRELYEETGLFLTHDEWRFFNYNDDLKDGQNISLRFIYCFEKDELPEVTNEHCEPDEVEDIKWIKLSRNGIKNYKWAFDHKQLVEEILKYKFWL